MSSKIKYEAGMQVKMGNYAEGTASDDVIFETGDVLTLEEDDDSGTKDNPAFLAKRDSDGEEGYVFSSELGGVVGEDEQEAEQDEPVAETKPKAKAKAKPAAKQEPDKEEPKAKAAPKAKAKVKPAPAPEPEAEQETEDDAETGETLQDLVKGDAKTVLANAKRVSDRLQTDFYYLGGILSEIADKKYFETLKGEDGKKLEGQPGFEAYVRSELGIEYRMALHYMSIFEALTAAGIPENKIKGLKWTKIAQIVKLIESGHINVKNWDSWANKIKNVKGDAFKEEVQSAMVDAGIEKQAARGATANQKKFTFVLFDDRAQLLEKAIAIAKKQIAEEQDGGEEPSNSAALDTIVTAYLQLQADLAE